MSLTVRLTDGQQIDNVVKAETANGTAHAVRTPDELRSALHHAFGFAWARPSEPTVLITAGGERFYVNAARIVWARS